MRLYLSGVEYYSYRKILKYYGARFGSLNYEYIYNRTPRFNLEQDTDFLDELIVYPGNLSALAIDSYIDFLNTHASSIKFAIEIYSKNRIMLNMDCEVEIIPWYYHLILSPAVAVSFINKKPFIKTQLLHLKETGTYIHGIDYVLPFFDSYSSSSWMWGSSGWAYYFDTKLRTYKDKTVFPSIARKLIKQGYELNLDKVKKRDWRELAKINCIAWIKQQEYLEVQ